MARLTLDNLQAGPVAGVGLLALLDLRAQALADALRNGGAVNLGARHDARGTGEVPARTRRQWGI
jgi:hypothetical protein